MSKKHKIKVKLGSSIKRSAALIDKDGNVLAEGENSAQLAKALYGRRR